MSKFNNLIKLLLMVFLILVSAQCASSKKNTWMEKRKKASHVNTTQLGRNRYYFSTDYQKKLNKSYKKKKY
jgi:Tfp pilus assembly protein PilP